MKTTLMIGRAVVLSAFLALAGCQTTMGPSPEEVQREEDMRLLQERIGKLQGTIQGLQMENQTLARDIEQLKGQMRGTGSVSQSRLDDLEKQVQALSRAREQDRAAIVDEITKKIAGLMKTQGSSKSSGSGGGGSDFGYEHIVKSGQTLSEISKAYGVSLSAIKKANNLKSDTVRVGQKLFIPEK